MKTNVPVNHIYTHEGAVAKHINVEQQLRRSVMSCLLWEAQFYEDGVAIADRIAQIIPKVGTKKVAAIAIEAREKMKLRHMPLLIVREMARIQSFPDQFEFRSKVTTGGQMRKFEVPQYTQVGNAVPPLLGQKLGACLVKLTERL
ncbi:hypothetical protein LCGC14_1588130 [marine sediment metagenome]|uniref:DNA (cytosine-5-)-methyltransferase n=1 Tax=marine sediment metagenome TaxID=412755 RepID=A0A0F9IET4_9ZZZZ